MDTDKAWRQFGSVDPYYGVLTSPEYRSDGLTQQARLKFFESGERHVEQTLSVLRAIDSAFTPGSALDFGCGVGRIAIPLARISDAVLGVDVSPGMLAEARKNAHERGLDNLEFSHAAEGTFDLVHSYIVLQHIAPRRGMSIVKDLAARVNDGGMIVLQVPYRRDAAAWRKFVTALKRTQPLINGSLNLVQGRRFNYPTMTMFCYDLSHLLGALRAAGFTEVRATIQTPYRGYESVILYAQRGRD